MENGKVVQCKKPLDPKYGFIISDDKDRFDVGDKIWFKCNRGFELNGVKDLECLGNGQWSDDFPTCNPEAVKCQVPDAPRKGHISPAGQTFFDVHDEIWFGCEVGYFLVGKESRTCLPNGQWSGRNPRCFCLFLRCFKPKPPANGKIAPEHKNVFQKNQKIWISCGTNYDLVGAKDLKCLGRNKWWPALPQCQKLCNVKNPKSPEMDSLFRKTKHFSMSEERFGSNAIVDLNVDLNGVKDLKCLRNGRWSAPCPRCDRKVVKCEKPDDPDNGSIRPDDQDFFDVDEKIWFSCERGFELKGKKDLQCRSNGKWSDKIPRCERKVVQCKKPLDPKYGFIFSDDKDRFDVGDKIWFKCNRGFELDGVKDLESLENGQWSDDFPTCNPEAVKCQVPDAPRKGHISPAGQTFFDVHDEIWFGCEVGYFLVGKESRTCLPNGQWSGRNPRCFFKNRHY
ncbi:P-selectin-like [Clavelina lepadiformis]|uniref:P-selectin-like n=1 Tax=Clavelina lepadiformis TaxID=159417 RepID=UPI004041D2A2